MRIVLLMSLIKFDRFEWMIEKATELGVETIIPLEADRSEKGLELAARKRIERWRKIARAAGQQSRRVHLPEILDAGQGTGGFDPCGAEPRFYLEETPGCSAIVESRIGEDRAQAWRHRGRAGWPGRRLDRSGTRAVDRGSLDPGFARSANPADGDSRDRRHRGAVSSLVLAAKCWFNYFHW